MMVSLKLSEIVEVAVSCPSPGLMPCVMKVAHITHPAVPRSADHCPDATNATGGGSGPG